MQEIIPRLWREIERKKELIESDPKYDFRVASKHADALIEQANIYSWFIEHPQLQQRVYERSRSKSQVRKNLGRLTQIARKQGKGVWEYLTGKSPLIDHLGHDLLIEIGQIINDSDDGYRNVRASLNFRDYTPPNYLKIREKLDRVFDTFKKMRNPLEAAFYLHLNIAGIQPFNDGNKRTARILQNRHLYENRMPPAILHPAERTVYITLLENALVGYRDHDPVRAYPFFAYFGGKVNQELDKILGTHT